MAINRYICKVIRYLNKLQFYLLPPNQVKSHARKRKEVREEKKNKKLPELIPWAYNNFPLIN
jgi:hypothetical protein